MECKLLRTHPLSVSFADSSPMGGAVERRGLSGGIQHVADEDAVAEGGVGDHDVGDSSN